MDIAAIQLDVFKIPGLMIERELTSGENNIVYLCKDAAEGRYVLRKKKPGSKSPPLLNERHTLLFLEHAGIHFAPKSLGHDPRQELHLISFLGERDISPASFNEREAQIFARQLAQVHSITNAQYLQWCDTNGVMPKPPETREQTLELYFTSAAANVRQNCPDPGLTEWVNARFNTDDCMDRAIRDNQRRAIFVHGDLGGNMRTDGKNIFFIDWERARFLEFSELGYVFIHGQCSPKVQKMIFDAYADSLNLDPPSRSALRTQVELEMNLLKVDKVLWRANKFTELFMQQNPEAEKYRHMAYEAIREQGSNMMRLNGAPGRTRTDTPHGTRF